MDKEMLEIISAIAGGVISWTFGGLVPKWKVWFDSLDGYAKRAVLLLATMVASTIIFGLSCLGYLDMFFPGLALECTQTGAAFMVKLVLFNFFTSQSSYTFFFDKRE